MARLELLELTFGENRGSGPSGSTSSSSELRMHMHTQCGELGAESTAGKGVAWQSVNTCCGRRAWGDRGPLVRPGEGVLQGTVRTLEAPCLPRGMTCTAGTCQNNVPRNDETKVSQKVSLFVFFGAAWWAWHSEGRASRTSALPAPRPQVGLIPLPTLAEIETSAS